MGGTDRAGDEPLPMLALCSAVIPRLGTCGRADVKIAYRTEFTLAVSLHGALDSFAVALTESRVTKPRG